MKTKDTTQRYTYFLIDKISGKVAYASVAKDLPTAIRNIIAKNPNVKSRLDDGAFDYKRELYSPKEKEDPKKERAGYKQLGFKNFVDNSWPS